ncbi:sister chromatid cohesion protein DCC1 [Cryptococcus bacillisporus CA1873]|uniref:Sister chromatid cohesion protein DCC1 n=1 Tax=Cryptococcus bacillisporus CA1873 TaxID=1296111 RepID=A0ABR5B5T3_CRYGA|nr:sister chromatid cohesion protein DCC1 [Cryptococcus bacillisporus CA1873]|eukprot:KIR58492.1 sister chromatid cohesion protein DCC1 [Cryptococcus gattii CA1873]
MNNALPEKNVVLRFPPIPKGQEDVQEEIYQLLELPPDLLKLVEALKDKEDGQVFPLTIKGRPSDDATLCTADSTFLLRTVGISNSLLVCLPPSPDDLSYSFTKDEEDRPTLQIRDICHQVLECIPVAPNLERIRTVLRASAWEGMGGGLGKRKREDGDGRKLKRWTKEQLRSVVQASDAELEQGLKERNVIEVDGRMLLLPSVHLKDFLNILLSLLAINSSRSPTTAPSQTIITALEEYDVPPSISVPVLDLFGTVEDGQWMANVERMVKEVGLGILCAVKKNKKRDEFMSEWQEEVGETWREYTDLKLLEGEYLLSPPPPSALSFASPSPLISYFPLASLPLQPAERFAELFLTRQRWRPEEMAPFLRGLTRDGDSKSRDKLVAKFVRIVKEKDGTWWYPRRCA